MIYLIIWHFRSLQIIWKMGPFCELISTHVQIVSEFRENNDFGHVIIKYSV